MIKHNFEDIAVNKDLHLEEYLANARVTHDSSEYEREVGDFFVDVEIDNSEVQEELFLRAFDELNLAFIPEDEQKEMHANKKSFSIYLSNPDNDYGEETAGIICNVDTSSGTRTAMADLSDSEKEVLLMHIAKELPKSQRHVDYEMKIINARSAERENSSPKKSQWNYEY